MTKKDYELIASVIKKCDPQYIPEIADIAQLFAEELACTNPRFNREIFLKACGLSK